MTVLATKPKLLLIQGGLSGHLEAAPPDKLLRVERYLARQSKAAHNLGVRPLEHYYLKAFLALKLWRITEQHRHPVNCHD